ncbi:hypothetical protein VNO78_33256 [Psophocarpus tetragonolobus]|uniref:DUF8039 domain-containing protein n=1 Tax=Psophocarpus tetragonolobus TaxID=3891 RepID=A0AAN9P218_PSOTE
MLLNRNSGVVNLDMRAEEEEEHLLENIKIHINIGSLYFRLEALINFPSAMCGKERVMEEKLKKRQTEAAQSGDESEVDPSSLPRHLKWKLARIKKTGSMTSEAAKKIVERIDMLEEQCKEGTIILEGRNDILTTAIGKPEHPGRVRGTEAGVGIRQYFGPLTRGPATSSSISPEVLQRLTQKITQDVTQELMKQFGSVLQSVNSQPPEVEDDTTPITRNSTINSQSPQPPVVEDDATPIIHNSRNVSCAVAATTNPSWETISADMSDRVMLYVKADPLRLVAIGRVHQWGSTQHGLDELVRVAVEVLDNVAPVSDELVRVAVEVVLDPVAPVPAPNEEVKLVGQAIGGFIVWPRHLLKVFSPKDTQRSEKQVPVVDRQKDTQRSEKQVPVVDRRKDTQRSEKQVPVVDRQKFWIMFCNKLSEDANNGKVYGFLEPQHIQKSGKKQEITKYMLTHLKESKKQIYLAPYYNEQHWQLLVLVPKENVAVWFCSVGKKPEKDIKQIVQDFFKGCQNIGSKRTRKSKPIINWIEPQCNQQSGGWEGGYYVMHWMSTIIQFSIKTNWKQLFRDTGELSKEVIERIRVQWAKYFLEFRNSI